MDLTLSEQELEIRDRVARFYDRRILPREPEWRAAMAAGEHAPGFMAELKREAFHEGLWNMALPQLAEDEPGTRLSNLAFAGIAEILGRLSWASEVFNCHAPDVPNMEILQMFGAPAQKQAWLAPLLNAEIRSAFAMTEPDVASSDATNIATRIERDGDDYVITGRKWFATGAGNPDCRFLIVVGVTDPDAARGARHSMVIVPTDTPGLTVVRNHSVFEHVDTVAPHSELRLDAVRVPVANRLGDEGDGFRIGQARLGPARVHHCMRAIGRCEVLIGLMLERARSRVAFGKPIAEYANLQDAVALSRIELDQARLLVQRTAWLLDSVGNQAARREVSMIKVAVARAYQNIADRAIQVFGARGVTGLTPLAASYAQARAFRIYDGPDEVHLRTIYRLEDRAAAERGEDLSAAYLEH